MPAIDVVSDASVALKWFHAAGEEEVAESRALVAAHQARAVALLVLDLTAYEVGNALMRGRAKASAVQVATVLAALEEICPAVRPDADELRLASELAERHELTVYDAAYAAVAESREATLATLDRALLKAGLGSRPSALSQQLDSPAAEGRREGHDGPAESV
jgi:predicted nucleic acid-binding protein